VATRKAPRKSAPKKKAKAAPKSKPRTVPKKKAKAAPKSKPRTVPRKKAKAAPKSKPRTVPKKKAKAAPKSKIARPAKTAPGALKPTRAAQAAPAKAKKVSKRPPPKRRPAKRKVVLSPSPVAVGDWVLVKSGEGGPGGLRIEGDSEATEGIVCSVREIATGKLVAKTTDDLGGFLLEVLHHRTFRPQFSSIRNTGAPAGLRPTRSAASGRLRDILRDSATHRRFYSYASGGLPNEVFGALLDGWRVVRVRATSVEPRQ